MTTTTIRHHCETCGAEVLGDYCHHHPKDTVLSIVGPESPAGTIRRLAVDCVLEALRAAGWKGDQDQSIDDCLASARAAGVWEEDGYELTAEDCRFVDDSFAAHHGRRPTKAEWADAGYPHVGGAHYER